MTAETHYRRLMLASACVGLGACESVELPPIIERSDVLILAAPTDREVCAGTFEHMDARVRALQELFGVVDRPVTVYWMPGADFDDSPCREQSIACAIDSDIFTKFLPAEHELVHAAREYSLPAPLEEGLATYWGDGWLTVPTGGLLVDRQQLHDIVIGNQTLDTDAEYERAAEFAAFLIAEHGVAKLDEFARRTDYDHSFKQWRPAFEEVFAGSWESFWQDYMVSPECTEAPLYRDVSLCDADTDIPAIEFSPEIGQPARYIAAMDCSNEDAVGPDYTGRARRIHIPDRDRVIRRLGGPSR